MIIGLGMDIVEIARIESVLARHGARFTERIFTPVERAKSDARRQRAASYARRWAAKEACAKALATGMRGGIAWRQIGVENDPLGKPCLRLYGAAAERLAWLTPSGRRAFVHLTLTDERTFALANVIIEARAP